MAPPALSVVVDTNVWISGLLIRTSVPGHLTRQIVLNARPVFTVQTFDELSSRLWCPKFDRYVTLEQRKRMLGDLSAVARWVEVPPDIAALAYCRDASDDKFIHAAIVSSAACLVTGDKDLLVLAGSLLRQGVRVLSPAAAQALPELARKA